MLNAVISFFRSLFAEPQHEKLLIRIPVDEKRNLYRRR